MTQTYSCRVLYSGRVQGVGFRYSVKSAAAGYEVVGWVRNLRDGRVELQVSGAELEVAAFLNAVEGQLAAHIKHVKREAVEAPPGGWAGFEIRHLD